MFQRKFLTPTALAEVEKSTIFFKMTKTLWSASFDGEVSEKSIPERHIFDTHRAEMTYHHPVPKHVKQGNEMTYHASNACLPL